MPFGLVCLFVFMSAYVCIRVYIHTDIHTCIHCYQVLGDDKKKFKTRSGEVTKLVDLLDEAVARARAQLEERMNTEGSTSQVHIY